MPRMIGIDLGTTNSLVAVVEGDQPRIILNRFGSRLTPSVVRFFPDGSTVVGLPAERARMQDPKHTVSGIKRFIGRYFNEVMDLAELVPYEVAADEDSYAVVQMYGREWSPVEISALILRELKESAEDYLGEAIEEAVITIPAYFNDAQHRATVAAGRLAGLNVKRLVAEPTAAALAHGHSSAGFESVELVLDLGGGTYDVSLLELGEGVVEVKAISGDGYLGGDDFDEALLQWALGEISHRHGATLTSAESLQRVREAVSAAKRGLSESRAQEIRLPFLFEREGRWIDVSLELFREDFESICDELFERLVPPIERVLKDSGLTKGEVPEVLLVGGATRAVRVSKIVKEMFGKEPSQRVHPEEAVGLGAAVQAAVLDGSISNMLLLAVIPFTISIEVEGGVAAAIISRNTTIPTRKSETFTTGDGQTSVEVHVLRGERQLAEDNRTLGRLFLEGLPALPLGGNRIEVTVEVDANMDIEVRAKDLGSGRSEKLRLLIR